ncbi:MAG: hypothetical protein H6746_08460 [Deltaproteobacteria bacterium]|nr:hypothetical protein [Deltaproteobacteria bacterium]
MPKSEIRSEGEPRRCRCGYAKGDGMVVEEPRYSFGGTLALLFGITARPIAVRYQCRKCGQVLEESTDPAVLTARHD